MLQRRLNQTYWKPLAILVAAWLTSYALMFANRIYDATAVNSHQTLITIKTVVYCGYGMCSLLLFLQTTPLKNAAKSAKLC